MSFFSVDDRLPSPKVHSVVLYVLKALKVKIVLFCSCSVVKFGRWQTRFGEIFCLHFQCRNIYQNIYEYASDVLLQILQILRRHFPKFLFLQVPRRNSFSNKIDILSCLLMFRLSSYLVFEKYILLHVRVLVSVLMFIPNNNL